MSPARSWPCVPSLAIAMLKDKEPGSFIVRDSHSFRGAYGLAMKVATPPPSVLQLNKKGRTPGLTCASPSPVRRSASAPDWWLRTALAGFPCGCGVFRYISASIVLIREDLDYL